MKELVFIDVDNIKVKVMLERNWLNIKVDGSALNHAEFHSNYVSETGYLSEFFYDIQVEETGGDIKKYLIEVAKNHHNSLKTSRSSKVIKNDNQQILTI